LLKRIAITGPESTGKSCLCLQLAKHFNTYCVEEYARKYIDDLKRPYNLDDIIKIAKCQLSNENKLAEKANELLFCDTELIVTKIWSEHKFSVCLQWILDNGTNLAFLSACIYSSLTFIFPCPNNTHMSHNTLLSNKKALLELNPKRAFEFG